MALKVNYKDFIPPESGRRWRITPQDDGSAIIEDITEYQQEGDTFGANDMNSIGTEVNSHISNKSNPHGVTASQVGAEPAFSKNSAFNKNFGSGAGTVCQGNDSRLSDARRASNITMQLSGTTLRVTYT